ncbi:hypothetical protein [Sneathiella limimaris]|uniref:hypothetical protein n=1 Tax=Sneathiella limimaris TaxID=1964213 RepID=UPI00146F80CA|nr:hypothetical protein [Sneathiella limimaris]
MNKLAFRLSLSVIGFFLFTNFSIAVDCDLKGDKRRSYLENFSSLYSGEDKPLQRCPGYDDVDPGFLNAKVNGVMFRIKRSFVVFPGRYEADGPLGEVWISPLAFGSHGTTKSFTSKAVDASRILSDKLLLLKVVSSSMPSFCSRGVCVERFEAMLMNILRYMFSELKSLEIRNPDQSERDFYQKVIQDSVNYSIGELGDTSYQVNKAYAKDSVKLFLYYENSNLVRWEVCDDLKEECFWGLKSSASFWMFYRANKIKSEVLFRMIPVLEEQVLLSLIGD